MVKGGSGFDERISGVGEEKIIGDRNVAIGRKIGGKVKSSLSGTDRNYIRAVTIEGKQVAGAIRTEIEASGRGTSVGVVDILKVVSGIGSQFKAVGGSGGAETKVTGTEVRGIAITPENGTAIAAREIEYFAGQ